MSDLHEMKTYKIFDAITVSAGSSETSDAIDLSALRPIGFFTLMNELAGSGVGEFTYLVSDDGGANYYTPTGAIPITSGIVSTSGPGGDGKDKYRFGPMVARHLKIRLTETGGGSSLTPVTTRLTIQ